MQHGGSSDSINKSLSKLQNNLSKKSVNWKSVNNNIIDVHNQIRKNLLERNQYSTLASSQSG